MRKLKWMIIGMLFFFGNTTKAQVSVNISVGSPPPWGPMGYTEIRYYYLPDIEAYYDIESAVFIYYTGGIWVRRAYLPSRYSNYDLYGGYKVVISDYRGNTPYVHFKHHKVKYAKGYKGPSQKTIGQKPGNVKPNKGADQNSKKSQGHGNEKGNSHKSEKNSKSDHGHGGGKGKKK